MGAKRSTEQLEEIIIVDVCLAHLRPVRLLALAQAWEIMASCRPLKCAKSRGIRV